MTLRSPVVGSSSVHISYHSDEDEFMLTREDSTTDKGACHHPEETVLTPDQISKKMFELVNEVNTVFQVRLA